METQVRTEITIETHEVMVIRRQGSYPQSHCRRCGEQATMLSLDEATALSNISTRKLFRLVEDGKLHFIETPKGTLLICSESLAAASPDQSLLTASRCISMTMTM